MPRGGTHVLGFGLLIFLADSILPDPRFLLMFPEANNNSVLFLLGQGFRFAFFVLSLFVVIFSHVPRVPRCAQDHAAAGITKSGTATVFAWKGDWVTSLRSFFHFRQTGVISKIVKLSLVGHMESPPSPSTISSAAMGTSEEEGLHFRPSSSHCGCFRVLRTVPTCGNGCHPFEVSDGCSTVEWSHVYYRPIFVGTLCTFCQRRNVVHGWDVNGPLTDRSP